MLTIIILQNFHQMLYFPGNLSIIHIDNIIRDQLILIIMRNYNIINIFIIEIIYYTY